MQNFVIGAMPAPLTPEIASRLAEVETATVGHFRHWGFMDPAIQPLGGNQRRVIGTAVTLALPGQDSTLLHHVLGLIRPGHIIVIDRLGDRRHACWGGGVTLAAKTAGAVAAIVDGMCTDPNEIIAAGLPVWCRGISPITTRVLGLGGLLNKPVSCAGVVVNPGDVLICDDSGILVLPPEEVEAVAAMALERQERGRQTFEKIKQGAQLGELSGASAIINSSLSSTGISS